MSKLEYPDFCSRTGLQLDLLGRSKLAWSVLQDIRKDYLSRQKDYLEAASQVATRIASFDKVHSTRFRAKDPDHLLAKIIRKTASYVEKPPKKSKGFDWSGIDASNYRQAVTDLAGVRALHLYKQDWFNIDQRICKVYKQRPKSRFAYVRQGDETDMYEFAECRVEVHDVGYRSVHYVVEVSPTMERLLIEIQVRTIFEEGWSEVDHQVRYPNFSNPLLEKFLTDFNLLSGLADSMGNFVQQLRRQLEVTALEVTNHKQEIQSLKADLAEMERELRKNKAYTGDLRTQFEEFKAKFESKTAESILKPLHFSSEAQTNWMQQALNRAMGRETPIQSLVEAMKQKTEALSPLGKCPACWSLTVDGVCTQCGGRDPAPSNPSA